MSPLFRPPPPPAAAAAVAPRQAAERSTTTSSSSSITCGETMLRNYEMPSGSGCRNPEDCHRRYMIYYPTSVCGGKVGTVPSAASSSSSMAVTLPVVFSVHCLGCSLESLQHWSEIAELYQFVWVNPEGIQRSFNAGDGEACCGYALEQGLDDFGFLQGILQELSAVHPNFVSSDWAYAMGWSNGGYMVSAAASLFRGIAPISGYHVESMPNNNNHKNNNHKNNNDNNYRPVALFLHHARDDHFVQPTGCCKDPTMPQCCCRISGYLDTCTSVEAKAEEWAVANGCGTTDTTTTTTTTDTTTSSSTSSTSTIISLDIPDQVTCVTYNSPSCQANTTYCLYPHKGHFNHPSFAAAFSEMMGRSVADFFAKHMCETANNNNNGGGGGGGGAQWDSESRTCTCSSQNPTGPYCFNTLKVGGSGNNNNNNNNNEKGKAVTDTDTDTTMSNKVKETGGEDLLSLGLMEVMGTGEVITMTSLAFMLLGLCIWYRRQMRVGGGFPSSSSTTAAASRRIPVFFQRRRRLVKNKVEVELQKL